MDNIYYLALPVIEIDFIKSALIAKSKRDARSSEINRRKGKDYYAGVFNSMSEREEDLYSKLDIIAPNNDEWRKNPTKEVEVGFTKYEIWTIEKALVAKKTRLSKELKYNKKAHQNMVELSELKIKRCDNIYAKFNNVLTLESRKEDEN